MTAAAGAGVPVQRRLRERGRRAGGGGDGDGSDGDEVFHDHSPGKAGRAADRDRCAAGAAEREV